MLYYPVEKWECAMNKKKAIVLLSGGLDSTTCLAKAKFDGYDCYAMSFLYGQKANVEITNAKKIATLAGVHEHRLVELPVLSHIGGSALTDDSLQIPDYEKRDYVPITYVPARNTIFLTMALAWGEVVGAYDIFIGANCLDYSNYPDCRPDYFAAFEKLAALGTKAGIEANNAKFKVHAPLLFLNKAQIIQLGLSLGVDYSKTISCYRANADGLSCGRCDSCGHRKKGFTEAGVPDPTLYV